ncbi:MAG: SH3 domain-containing protein, partial [Clostridia bacterium]|nr:SH3 domain-containing protein [Clostridia bacterium]
MWKKSGKRLVSSVVALGLLFSVMPEVHIGENGAARVAHVAAAADTASGAGVINASGVNFRVKPAGDVIDKLERGTAVEILSIPAVVDNNHWYQIRYNGKTGYVQAPFIT